MLEKAYRNTYVWKVGSISGSTDISLHAQKHVMKHKYPNSTKQKGNFTHVYNNDYSDMCICVGIRVHMYVDPNDSECSNHPPSQRQTWIYIWDQEIWQLASYVGTHAHIYIWDEEQETPSIHSYIYIYSCIYTRGWVYQQTVSMSEPTYLRWTTIDSNYSKHK